MGNRLERKNLLSLMASFVVITAGMAAGIVIAIISAPDTKLAVGIVVGLFAGIALIPLIALLPAKHNLPGSAKKESLWSLIKSVFVREEEKQVEIKTWKRKRIDYIPQPHGTRANSTFVPSNDVERKLSK